MKRTLFLLLLVPGFVPTSALGVDVEPAFPSLLFVQPVDLQNAGDGSNRLFLVERPGRIWVFDNHPDTVVKTLFLDIESRVNSGAGEEGLLGLAFHPAYPDSPYFYVNYTAILDTTRTVVARYAVSSTHPDSALFDSELVVLDFIQPFPNHNGGQLAFGPDGFLYVSVGDGGNGGDPLGNGQNRQTLLGSLLRIDVDIPSGGKNYSVPADNPFVGNTMGYREEIYAYGLRNPWRFSFDSSTGILWLADVGQALWEEVDIIASGGNYGWNVTEGMHCFEPSVGCNMTGLELPVWEYAHGADRSVTGGYVYRGAWVLDLFGKYIYGDFNSGKIWSLEYDGINPPVNTLLIDTALFISTFGVDENNELFVCNFFEGRIYRLQPTVTGAKAQSPPARGVLGQNRPNPFNPTTTIEFSIHGGGHVVVDVFDVRGAAVRTLVDRMMVDGAHTVTWDARDGGDKPVATGVYFYRLLIDGETVDVRRSVLLK